MALSSKEKENKMSTLTTKARNAVRTQNMPSNSATAGVNRAGGVAFEVSDPALKLVTMAGGSFFAEPKFYSADACVAKRGANGKLDKLVQRIELADGKLTNVIKSDELDDTARELLATAVSIAEGKNPEDMLAIANWLRNEVNIRLTPQVLLILASRLPGTQSLVRLYAKAVVQRPDEVKTCLLLHRYFFGFKTMKNSLAMGLSDAVHKFGEVGLLKYEGAEYPAWKDVLCTLPRKKGWPLKDEVAKYFISGTIVDAAKTPVIAARVALGKCKKFDATARQYAKASRVNWEVVLSQFPNDKKAVWEFLIETNQLGYMATLRNLRNLLQAGITGSSLQKVSDKLSSKDEVAKSKQLPFRFLMAHKIVSELTGTIDSADAGEMMAAIELAINEAAYNVPEIPGTTVVFCDDSGSMRQPVSAKSQVQVSDAARAISAIIAKRGQRVYLNAFSDSVQEVKFSKNDTVIGISSRIPFRSCYTYGAKCIEWLMSKNIAVDRIVIMSDQQCYEDSSGATMADLWKKYRKLHPEAWMHSIHLNGSGDTPIKEGDHVNLIGGFSEKVITMLLQAESAGPTASKVAKALPTVEQIRAKWSISATAKAAVEPAKVEPVAVDETEADEAEEAEASV
jgi:hypothetical protein